VFDDSTAKPTTISYRDQLDIRNNYINSFELKPGVSANAIISKPTFFRINSNQFLIYPGEKLKVVKGKYNDFSLTTENNRKNRNNELVFFSKFDEVEQYPRPFFILGASLDSILALEKHLITSIPTIAEASRYRFDSLQRQLNVSRKFKKLTRGYLANRYDMSRPFFYRLYADTLKAHGIYQDKLKQLLPVFNGLKTNNQLRYKVLYLNDLVYEAFSLKIFRISDEAQLRNSFDTVNKYFNGLSRDYLLSQVMYYAIRNDILLPPGLVSSYENTCREKNYKRLIAKLREEQSKKDRLVLRGANLLLFPDGISTTPLSEVVQKYQGKVIMLDFWAHWCGPCREEMPALKKLTEDYKKKDIVFIRISIDKEVQPWKKTLIADNDKAFENYLLLNYTSASIVIDNAISSIPRYLVFNKQGEIVNSNAPRPGDPRLRKYLNGLLLK
jgi:thiol-disulfide isomerase/thioredoxin